MRVLIFEWFYGGGGWQLDRSSNPENLTQTSFFVQGRQMLNAVAEDFIQLGHQVTLLEDARLIAHPQKIVLPGVSKVPVASFEAICSQLVQASALADRHLLIAPETDQILLDCCKWLDSDQDRSLSPNLFFVQLASNKQQTVEWLSKRGVKTPTGCLLSEFKRLPIEIRFPSIVKPIDGAGGDDLYRLNDWREIDQVIGNKDLEKYRIEEFIDGVSVSVSVIGNRQGYQTLPATEQLFDKPISEKLAAPTWKSYIGARFPPGDPRFFNSKQQADLAARANHLAQHALRALPETKGYFGLDMVLSSKGRGFDTVIEVNPRLTSSYIWLRKISKTNLVEKMLEL